MAQRSSGAVSLYIFLNISELTMVALQAPIKKTIPISSIPCRRSLLPKEDVSGAIVRRVRHFCSQNRPESGDDSLCRNRYTLVLRIFSDTTELHNSSTRLRGYDRMFFCTCYISL